MRTRSTVRARISLAVAMLAATMSAPGRVLHAQATPGPTMVILVRHAEKAAAPANDPDLSADGLARAAALREALADVSPTSMFITATRRTAQTAAPTAAKYSLTPIIVRSAPAAAGTPSPNPLADQVSAIADAIRQQQGVVVVVGHSNTVPMLIAALGGPSMPDLCDAAYDNLFVLTPANAAAPASLIRAHYGAADAANASCGAMTPAR